jgi:hypothetical protein
MRRLLLFSLCAAVTFACDVEKVYVAGDSQAFADINGGDTDLDGPGRIACGDGVCSVNESARFSATARA